MPSTLALPISWPEPRLLNSADAGGGTSRSLLGGEAFSRVARPLWVFGGWYVVGHVGVRSSYSVLVSKKRTERAKKARRQQRNRKQGAADEPPRGRVAAAAADHVARLSRYAAATDSPEEAAEVARAELLKATDAISVMSQGIGIVHAVSALRVALAMQWSIGGPDTSAAVLEVAALVLAGQVATSLSSERAKSFSPPTLLRAAEEAVDVGMMMAFLELAAPDQDAKLVFLTVQREILLRNPVYPHMLLDTLRRIVADDQVNQDCQDVFGFRGSEAVEVMEAVRQAAISKLEARLHRMLAARDASLPFIEQRAANKPDTADALRTFSVAREVFDAAKDLTTDIDTATVIDIDEVTTSTGIPTETVSAVLDAYTLGEIDDNDAVTRFFRGDNPLRPAPIIRDSTGRRMLVHDALALPAIREVIESGLKGDQRDQRYNARRGKVTEDIALDLLAGALPAATVYRGFDYFVPNPKSAAPETVPEMFTKRVEGDGLLLIDDVAIIVEVKSAALTPEARAGVAARLRGKLRDIVTNAAEQADRLRTLIETDGRIRTGKNTWIDVSGVREVHTIAVSLDDLSGVSTATAALIDAGLLHGERVPWTVSVHDLRIICELVDRPSELLFYLRRRTNPDVTRKYLAIDELDLYLHAITRGLWVEPDPVKRAASMPWKAEAGVGDKRRYAAERREVIESRTDALDAWYATQLNPAAPSARKPRLTSDDQLLKIIDSLAATGSFGSLPISATLLEFNARSQHTLARHPRDLARQVTLDGRSHMVTQVLTDTSGKVTLVVLVCRGKDATTDTTTSAMPKYLAAKKYQMTAHRAIALIFDRSGRNLERVIYNNTLNEPNPELGAAIELLVPVERMTGKVQRPGRRGKTGRGPSTPFTDVNR